MQKISFTTASAGTIEIDDVNVSSLNGERIFRLDDFDGNSSKTRTESVQCSGMPGQRTVLALPDVKTIMLKLSFAPVYMRSGKYVCTGSAGMYALRREVLRFFPIGEEGTLVYTDPTGTYMIRARPDEIPVVTVQPGNLCQCTLYLTADYPYWTRTVVSERVQVTGGSAYTFRPTEYGDIASPVGGLIRCDESLSGGSDISFRLVNSDDLNKRIDFVEWLSKGDYLRFSFRHNNEWSVTLNGYNSFTSVYFVEYSEPCISNPGRSQFNFELLCPTGSLSVQLYYYNIFVAV